MPTVQPAELWQESGRWIKYGPELLRFKDRHDREFLYGPTHEEVITDIGPARTAQLQAIAGELLSNPAEIPRRDSAALRRDAGAGISHEGRLFLPRRCGPAWRRATGPCSMAYTRIFTRLGLKFRAVQADGGSIGGSTTQEFHVLADSGEDAIAFSDGDDYAANVETAATLRSTDPRAGRHPGLGARCRHPTPAPSPSSANSSACARSRPVKTLLVDSADGGVVAFVIRGDHELNAVKAQKLAGVANPLRMSSATKVREAMGSDPGSVGPIGFAGTVYVDHAAAALVDFVCGANEKDVHYTGVNWGPRSSRTRLGGCPQRAQGGPESDRPRHARHRAGHRSRTYFSAGAVVQRGHEGHRARRAGQGHCAVHGVLRHRRHARGRRRHRTEPRRQRHHLARCAGALPGRAGSAQLSEVRGGDECGRQALRGVPLGRHRRPAR